MKKSVVFLSLLITASFQSYADDEYDDIYYNPDKKKEVKVKVNSGENISYGRTDVDVDTYNRRGTYYETPVDTIGQAISNGEDFVYTQQIQKYYNPTIVIDNASTLSEVMANSYGNVNIIIDNGLPAFAPIVTPYNYWTYSWVNPVNVWWDLAWGWNYPYYGWSWNWGPSWSWGWGPTWGWNGPWYPAPGHRPPHYRPTASWNGHGNSVNHVNGGWATSGRPGSTTQHRYSRPNSGNNRYHNNGSVNNHRNSSTVNNNRISIGGKNNGNAVFNSNGHRQNSSRNDNYYNSNSNHRDNNSYRQQNNNNSYRQNNGTNHRSSGSFGGNSRGGSRSGGMSTRGGGGGRHR